MGIVPGVIIHKGSPIGKSSDLISIVPPTHDDAFLLGVHPQPVVSLTVVVNDVLLAVVGGGEDD